MQGLAQLIQDIFKIRPEEFRRTILSFTYLFMTIGAFITSRITRSVLFLEIKDYKAQLPLTYIGIAISVSTVMFFYTKVERKLRRDHTNTITLAVIIAITLGFRFLLDHPWGFGSAQTGMIIANPLHEVYWAFYFWTEIVGTILIVQFWSFTNEIFHSRQAKRLFALIGGGGVLSNIIMGAAIGPFVKFLGTENLLYVICGSLFFAFLAVRALGKEAGSDLDEAKARGPRKKAGGVLAPGQRIFATRHVQLMAGVVIVTYIVSTIVDYQFNVVVGDQIPLKDARSAYYGNFFLYTGLIGGVIQFFLTARILERFGVLFALLLLPLCMSMGSVGVLASMGAILTMVTITKGSENVLRYTINDSTLQLLYLPVPAAIRGRAKAVIDGIFKPVSVGIAGFSLALLVGNPVIENLTGIHLGLNLQLHTLSMVVLGTLLAWVVLLVVLRREYLKSLVQTLQKRRLNFADADFRITDDNTIKTLLETLSSDNMGEVLHALELLHHVNPAKADMIYNKVVTLLKHDSDEIRVATLRFLGRRSKDYSDATKELFTDNSAQVRCEATLAYARMKRHEAFEAVQEMLKDDEKNVQAAAVAGLIQYGGIDGILASADHLKSWFVSENHENRKNAAWILGEVGVDNFYQPLLPLLKDKTPAVRTEAIHAAGRLKNRELIEPLIDQLEFSRMRSAAVAALVAYGADIEDRIATLLANHERSPEMRTQACKILGKLGDAHAAQILTTHLQDDSAHVRSASLAALLSITHRLPGLLLNASALNEAIHSEAKRWYGTTVLLQDLNLEGEDNLLIDALTHRHNIAKEQIIQLLILKYPGEAMELVARNLKSHDKGRQANAVEVLDTQLSTEEKLFITPLFEGADRAKLSDVAATQFTIQSVSQKVRLEELLTGGDPWLQSCAAMELVALKEKGLQKPLKALLKSRDKVVVETANDVIKKLQKLAA